MIQQILHYLTTYLFTEMRKDVQLLVTVKCFFFVTQVLKLSKEHMMNYLSVEYFKNIPG